MLLKNLHWYSEGQDGFGDIRITKGKIEGIEKGLTPRFREHIFNLSGCLALPGLINPHDHLDFNLLPIRGNPPYSNLTEYRREIYRPHESPIREMLNVDMRDRMLWGGYKNLISGVTTVCHHNPYQAVCENGFPVRVSKDVAWTHSLTYSKDPVGDFKKARGRPFVIHAAEGIDDSARLEITELQRLGMLRENTVIVHGVGMKDEEITHLQKAGAALIWCPGSNMRLFGKTAPIDQMTDRVLVTLGTDSLLTANPTLFHELRAALDTGLATSQELFEMVTTRAADILKLAKGAGTLRAGSVADLVVLPDAHELPADTLVQSQPADLRLVLVGGDVRLADQDLQAFRPNAAVDGRHKFLAGKLGKLKNRICKKVGAQADEILNSLLWQMLQAG